MASLLRLFTSEADREKTHTLEMGTVLVGGDSECDIQLGHPAVSRRHARFECVDGSWTLEDLQSSNGTFVDGRRIRGKVAVEGPAVLRFGPVTARLEALEPDDIEAAIWIGGEKFSEAPPEEEASRLVSTIQGASIQRLVTEMLPRWIDALEAQLDAALVAQRVGASLFETLPLRTVEMTQPLARGTGGLIYRATAKRPPQTDPPQTNPPQTNPPQTNPPQTNQAPGLSGDRHDSASVVIDGRRVRCEALFVHPLQARAYRPVVESAVRFIELGRLSETAPQPPRIGAALPEPGTVVPAVQELYAAASKVAAGEISVLITGESGTGKEVLAKFIHRSSPRHAGPFIPLNCAALSRDLLESELFGIEAGVATGVKPRAGCFERADGGTLFLDEIGDMAPETQASILRVLQEKEVFRLGGRVRRSANVRVLAATNRDVDALLSGQDFRSDLYHRIADWRVELPPLRRRRADVTNLAAHFLMTHVGQRGLGATGISKRAASALERYHWPGNIRQLEREIARAALFLEVGELLQSRHLSAAIQDATVAPQDPGGEDRTLQERLEVAERRILTEELRRHGGDVRSVARILGIGRSTLYRRIREWGLDTTDLAAEDS